MYGVVGYGPAGGGKEYGDVTAGGGPTGAPNVGGGEYGLVICTGWAGVGNCTRCAEERDASIDSIPLAPTTDNSKRLHRVRVPAV